MKTLRAVLVLLFCVVIFEPLSAGTITVGQSTTLDRLIAGEDSIEYPELSFSGWNVLGSLGVTPATTSVSVLADYRLDFGIQSPGFELISYTLNPADGYQVSSLQIPPATSGLTSLATIGDLGTDGESLSTTWDRDVITGVNSAVFSGSFSNKFSLSEVLPIPEPQITAVLASVPVFLFGLLRRRR